MLDSEIFAFSGNITGIDVSNAITVCIRQGEEEHFEISADDNILPHISVRQLGETVFVYLEAVSFIGRAPDISVYVTVKELKKLHLT
ncbi:MAG: DUF2807 domain-containing protein, partial [Bacteroidales bacterium]|nr:DUF2807 domain-containing protein [Bacteroidales bacterium]